MANFFVSVEKEKFGRWVKEELRGTKYNTVNDIINRLIEFQRDNIWKTPPSKKKIKEELEIALDEDKFNLKKGRIRRELNRWGVTDGSNRGKRNTKRDNLLKRLSEKGFSIGDAHKLLDSDICCNFETVSRNIEQLWRKLGKNHKGKRNENELKEKDFGNEIRYYIEQDIAGNAKLETQEKSKVSISSDKLHNFCSALYLPLLGYPSFKREDQEKLQNRYVAKTGNIIGKWWIYSSFWQEKYSKSVREGCLILCPLGRGNEESEVIVSSGRFYCRIMHDEIKRNLKGAQCFLGMATRFRSHIRFCVTSTTGGDRAEVMYYMCDDPNHARDEHILEGVALVVNFKAEIGLRYWVGYRHKKNIEDAKSEDYKEILLKLQKLGRYEPSNSDKVKGLFRDILP